LNSLFGVQSLENGTRFRMRALSKLTWRRRLNISFSSILTIVWSFLISFFLFIFEKKILRFQKNPKTYRLKEFQNFITSNSLMPLISLLSLSIQLKKILSRVIWKYMYFIFDFSKTLFA
jgi:hypothetical protein